MDRELYWCEYSKAAIMILTTSMCVDVLERNVDNTSGSLEGINRN